MHKGLIVALLFLSACSSKSSGRSSREYSFWDALFSNSYVDVFDDHTTRKVVLSEFEPVMTMRATLWDQSMREAYVKEMADHYRYSEEAEKKLAEEELKENESFFVFILSASTREPEWNEFERQSSMWRITLEDEGGKIQVDPESIRAISQRDEKAKYFYPSMSNFTRTYRVRFEKKALHDLSPIKLHISGARGHLLFEWQNQK